MEKSRTPIKIQPRHLWICSQKPKCYLQVGSRRKVCLLGLWKRQLAKLLLSFCLKDELKIEGKDEKIVKNNNYKIVPEALIRIYITRKKVQCLIQNVEAAVPILSGNSFT